MDVADHTDDLHGVIEVGERAVEPLDPEDRGDAAMDWPAWLMDEVRLCSKPWVEKTPPGWGPTTPRASISSIRRAARVYPIRRRRWSSETEAFFKRRTNSTASS